MHTCGGARGGVWVWIRVGARRYHLERAAGERVCKGMVAKGMLNMCEGDVSRGAGAGMYGRYRTIVGVDVDF